ncbi:hypothetical protein [Enterovibrio baiacu]|uniref:hypothetical protein n=1 Tax=Enterovibrio baiacu TaxID=2491023 RepID=UPI0010123FAF|nr:hypothetical protein [Enterovibrio baiacu]MBE1276853.1 hypothetical protein [Enterovibrio baiacu]
MSYDKTFKDEDGDEYPYYEWFDEDSYYYHISVVWREREGELFICKWGSHIVFDDDRSWLSFSVTPEEFFPKQKELTTADILSFMDILSDNVSEARVIDEDELKKLYRIYKSSFH